MARWKQSLVNYWILLEKGKKSKRGRWLESPYLQYFMNYFGILIGGLWAALAWESLLYLIGRGFVASTFGVVAIFMVADFLLRFTLFGLYALVVLVLVAAVLLVDAACERAGRG